MEDRCESALWKIERARKHADDLEAEVEAFWSAGHFQIDEVESSLGAVAKYQVTSLDLLPESVPLMVGDAAHNIRSALDHFAFAAVPNPDEDTAFPIWRKRNVAKPTVIQWQKKVGQQLNGASSGLLQAIQRLEPWKTGKDAHLWAIHELDRVDKHRLLISLSVVNTLITLEGEGYDFETVRKFSWHADDNEHMSLERTTWVPLEVGTILFDTEKFAGLGITDVRFSLAVALGEPDELRGSVAVSQLRGLATAAEQLIENLAMLA
jgi:hypothetical protein